MSHFKVDRKQWCCPISNDTSGQPADTLNVVQWHWANHACPLRWDRTAVFCPVANGTLETFPPLHFCDLSLEVVTEPLTCRWRMILSKRKRGAMKWSQDSRVCWLKCSFTWSTRAHPHACLCLIIEGTLKVVCGPGAFPEDLSFDKVLSELPLSNKRMCHYALAVAVTQRFSSKNVYWGLPWQSFL